MTDPVAVLLARLTDPTQTASLVDLAFDHVIAQPVVTFVDADRILEWAKLSLRESVTAQVVGVHVRGFVERERTRAAKRADRVDDWLTPEAVAVLRELARRPIVLDRELVRAFVHQDAVRHLLRTIVEETLGRFVQTVMPSGGSGGIMGSLGQSALGFASRMKKTLIGNIGLHLESQLHKAAKTFVETSLGYVLERVVELLASEESAARMGRLAGAGFDKTLPLTTDRIWRSLGQASVDALLEVVAGLIAHNLERPEVQEILTEEIAAMLQIEGERPLEALLDESGTTSFWRDEIRRVAVPQLNRFCETDAFRNWLTG